MAIDPRSLRPGELCRLINSTTLGEVISERQLHRHRTRAGKRVCADGDQQRVELLRYAAWLVQQRHAPKLEPEGLTGYEAHKERARDRVVEMSRLGRDIGELPEVVDRQRQVIRAVRQLADRHGPRIQRTRSMARSGLLAGR